MTRLGPYLATILISLPFTMGLTLPVVVPLKIYEVVGAVALVVLLTAHRVEAGPSRQVLLLWFLLLAGSFVSAIASLLLLDGVNTGLLDWAQGRFVPVVNLAYNLVYLGFVLGLGALFVHALYTGALTPLGFVRFWLFGALAAAVYAVALNLLHWAGLPRALLLHFGPVQTLPLGGLDVVRGGPFLEGNYLGLYMALSCAFALWAIRERPADAWLRRLLVPIVVGTVISGAPLALLGVGALLAFAACRREYPTSLRRLLGVGLVVALMAGASSNLVRVQFMEKLSLLLTGGVADHGNVSLIQRSNEAYKAWLMFRDHPWLGVGVGNFGYHAWLYPELFTWMPNEAVVNRQIPNNVYLEVLAEQGAPVFLVFVAALAMPWRRLWRRRLALLLIAYTIMLVYFMAFPSYKLAFLWVAMAFFLHEAYRRPDRA